MQNFPRIFQNYLIFNAFFSKILVKSQNNFEKSQENFSKRSGKVRKNFSAWLVATMVTDYVAYHAVFLPCEYHKKILKFVF